MRMWTVRYRWLWLWAFLCLSLSQLEAQVIYRINAGGPNYTDGDSQLWQTDSGFYNTGNAYTTTAAIAGTDKVPLYQSERWDQTTGAEMVYELPVGLGQYRVRLHFAEIYGGAAFPGGRVFDVVVEGAVAINDLDIYSESGYRTATIMETVATVTDGSLSIQFDHEVENPKISAIEVEDITVLAPGLGVDPAGMDFATVVVGQSSNAQQVTLTNTGTSDLHITAITVGGDFSSDALASYTIAPAGSEIFNVSFLPTVSGSHNEVLEITSDAAGPPLQIPLAGQAVDSVPPTLELSSSDLDFGSVEVGNTGATMTLDLTNSGTDGLNVSDIVLSGAAAGDYSVVHAALPVAIDPLGGSVVQVQVDFTPSQTGPRDALLTIQSEDPTGDALINLSGIGATVTTSSVYYINAGGPNYTDPAGREWLSDISSSWFNTGNVATTGSAITGTDKEPLYQSERWDGSGSPEMLYSLAVAAGQYRVRLHFAEIYGGAAFSGGRIFDVLIEGQTVLNDYDIFADVGYATATVKEFIATVSDTALDIEFLHETENPKISAIEVEAITDPVAILHVSSADLNFGDVDVGNTSVPAGMTLTNVGSAVLNISSIAASGVFSTDAAAGYNLAPAESVNFNVFFTPLTGGVANGSLEIFSNDGNSPETISLTGQGLVFNPGQLNASSLAVNFGDVTVGNTSSPTPVLLTNVGGSDLTVSAIALGGASPGEFSVNHAVLPFVLLAGQANQLQLDIDFSPVILGTRQAEVAISSDDPNSPAVVALSGTAIPAVDQVLYRVNCGGSAFTDSQNRAWQKDTGFYNTGKAYKTTATVAGTNEQLLYQSDRWDHPSAPEMSYNFTVAPGQHRVRLHFAELYSGIQGPGERVFDVNIEGQEVLSDYDVYAEVGFLTATSEEFIVDVIDTTLTIEFIHQVENPKISGIEIESLATQPNVMSVNPVGVDFGSLLQFTVSAPVPVTLTNNGNDPITITDFVFTGTLSEDVSVDVVPNVVVPPAGSTDINLTFAPQTAGTLIGLLEIVSDDPGGSSFVSLDGQSNPAGPENLAVNPASIDFVETALGQSSTAVLVMLTNNDSTSHTFEAASMQGGSAAHFALGDLPVFPLTLAPAEATMFNVSFVPLIVGAHSAQVQLDFDGLTYQILIPLTGTAMASPLPILQVNPKEVPFADVSVGQSSGDVSLTLVNNDTVSHEFFMTEMLGIDPNDFAAVNLPPLPITLQPQETLTFDVNFTPQVTGPRSGNLKLHFDNHSEHVHIALSGNGVDTAPTSVQANPTAIHFKDTLVGEMTTEVVVTVTNHDSVSHQIFMWEMLGSDPNDFTVTQSPAVPLNLNSGGSTQFVVRFNPTNVGVRQGDLKLHFDSHAFHVHVLLEGVALSDQPNVGGGVIYRINAGESDYTDPQDNFWQNDSGFYNTGNTNSESGTINGTDKPDLYLTDRWDLPAGSEMLYSFPIDPVPGIYLVRLHFAETYNGTASVGARVFDVVIEGDPVLVDYDIFAEVGYRTAVVEEFDVFTADGSIDIEFIHKVENPKINAIEVELVATDPGDLIVTPATLNWGHVEPGQTGAVMDISLTNPSAVPVTLGRVSLLINSGVGHDFRLTIDGVDFVGSHEDTSMITSLIIDPNETVIIPAVFEPTESSDKSVTIMFEGNFFPQEVLLLGVGGDDTGHPFLHTVIDAFDLVVDYDLDGFEEVFLQGDASHTHEFGHVLVAFEWSENSVVFATTVNAIQSLAVGDHDITLTVFDDNVPPEQLSATQTISVVTPNAIPGALLLYYDTAVEGATYQLDPAPVNADFAEVLSSLSVDSSTGMIGTSPFVDDVLVRMVAQVDITTAGDYEFFANGGFDQLVLLNGTPLVTPVTLSVGQYDLDVRFAVTAAAQVPLSVTYALNGGTAGAIPAGMISHDQTALVPVINSAPTDGINLGGNPIDIAGLGFFPADQVTVHWGSQDLTGASISVSPNMISFLSPPGTGSITVTVETPAGISNGFVYTYSISGPVPVNFSVTDLVPFLVAPTRGAWGSDGRLYVASVTGEINAYTFDDAYNITATQTITTLTGLSNNNILGLACNPHESNGPVKLYVGHGFLFANGGACIPEGEVSDYSGQISVLTGPAFDTIDPLITGLPVSNHDHAINGLEFDNQGDLYICIGSNTNAGIIHCNLGELPESPLTAAIVKAHITRSGFNGQIEYEETVSGLSNNDQLFGDIVDVVAGVDVDVFAPGFRNPFDLVFTTWELFYGSDNGPNSGFGAASTGPITEGPHPDEPDEVNLIRENNYYGHPNRNRGRYDSRQNVFHGTGDVEIPGVFTQVIQTVQPSSNGILEYRANTFNGAMRDELLVQHWNAETFRFQLSGDKQTVNANLTLPTDLDCLDIVTGPGGVIFGIDYSDNKLIIAKPVDVGVTGLTVYDIHPWRAPAAGGSEFIVGGEGFGTMGDTQVTIAGIATTLTSVSSTRIKGIVPENLNPTTALQDVVVTVGAAAITLDQAFRYLFDPQADTLSVAYVEIDPGHSGPTTQDEINESSTYNINSFLIDNDSAAGQSITRVEISLAGAILPDVVYDPDGTAGDPVGKDFTIDTDDGVGVVNYQFLDFHDGGYDALEITFNNFTPGKTLKFSVDVDPTNIKGAADPGPNHSGSISGLETIGGLVTVEFDDATMHQNELSFLTNRVTGSMATLKANLLEAPIISVVGQATPAIVNNANQTIHISGPAGTDVRLAHLESALYLAGVPGGGYDIDPFESNTAVAVTEFNTTIGPGGFVDVPVTLTQTDPDGGYNSFSAALLDANGVAGRNSANIVLQYVP